MAFAVAPLLYTGINIHGYYCGESTLFVHFLSVWLVLWFVCFRGHSIHTVACFTASSILLLLLLLLIIKALLLVVVSLFIHHGKTKK